MTHEKCYARIIRFVEPGSLPRQNILALYSSRQNLLLVDRDHYERLDNIAREELFRTEEPVTYRGNYG